MSTTQHLETIARFLGELGYKSAEGERPTAGSIQATIQSLAVSLEQEVKMLQVGSGGITLSREEGETGPLVLRVGLFDVDVERLERDGALLLTRLSVRLAGGEEDEE